VSLVATKKEGMTKQRVNKLVVEYLHLATDARKHTQREGGKFLFPGVFFLKPAELTLLKCTIKKN
jgi:hypothetical protein